MLEQIDKRLTKDFQDAWEKVKSFTMTSPERGFALWNAVTTIVDNDIPGAFVECGVWKGGSSMLIMLALLHKGVANRDIYLFDTFEGMTLPGETDVDLHGDPASKLMEGIRGPEIAELVKASIGFDDVYAAIASTGYDMRLVRLIKGDARETVKRTQTFQISLLRLDTDFYDSTFAELEYLYPRLTKGGVLIIDDYGHWQGARQAVEDYFLDNKFGYKRPILWAFDYTGWGGIKIDAAEEIEIDRYDYAPPGLTPHPDLLPLFPHARIVNPWTVGWPYLRSGVPHIWRSDRRDTSGYVIGNASAEEAACLYALAKLFSGKRGLEIGSHFGWTGAHLLSAGLRLDCIDPAFFEENRKNALREVFDAISPDRSYKLWAGFSPDILEEVYASDPEPWSFAFIDGNHDGEAPYNDAVNVLNYLAEDALVVFHDLTSPFVEKGLEVFLNAGFNVKLFNTMQILGVAWRGDVNPPEHVRDQNTPMLFQSHLAKYL
ncbi:class I SAM-dependent methyltransferase [Methylobacterium sp. J-068]|uniref:class I SAM-dependent methyltransferase n=1 Tax=Methylobacterium sp. J-068 TaxID=2836649 RepID=UPI001FBA3528|nr:TylF/MycF/NovP-related O-methyltransferase [Methylobacterium sp. J-068]MCJ2033402.1 class I SAM-dependent methyltransferase [Methylobacterium sp. J-068]